MKEKSAKQPDPCTVCTGAALQCTPSLDTVTWAVWLEPRWGVMQRARRSDSTSAETSWTSLANEKRHMARPVALNPKPSTVIVVPPSMGPLRGLSRVTQGVLAGIPEVRDEYPAPQMGSSATPPACAAARTPRACAVPSRKGCP